MRNRSMPLIHGAKYVLNCIIVYLPTSTGRISNRKSQELTVKDHRQLRS
jgi:hypothetical protein